MDYLTVEEVARALKAHKNTIYKMCRQGSLPAVKIGKKWRVDRHELVKYMKGAVGGDDAQLLSDMARNVLIKGHILGVFEKEETLSQFEVAYFKQAPKNDYRLFKGCWWQHPDEVREAMSRNGIPIERLESEGALVIENLSAEFEKSGPVGAAATWLKATTRALEKGYKGLVGSGSPDFECCGDYGALLEFESSLDKMLKDQPVMGVCSYVFDSKSKDGLSRLLDLIQRHDRFFIVSGGKSMLARECYDDMKKL